MAYVFAAGNFSIHALLAESDRVQRGQFSRIRLFYPRSPCGERLCTPGAMYNFAHFLSTLSLRRATKRYWLAAHFKTLFYPRSPCGERLRARCIANATRIFLSTLSLRRATIPAVCACRHLHFLSTLSLRRATVSRQAAPAAQMLFYPRSPCGERPAPVGYYPAVSEFSIHALLAESDVFDR